jgi:glyoxylase-like metal-dependent hydrolase (beta-lactamase superfamily II)
MLQHTFPVGPLACNCSIVADENRREALVIDPGDNVDDILSFLREQRLALKAIAVTHGHIDHIGGAAKLKRATGAPVYLNTRDAPIYDSIGLYAKWIGVATPERTSIDADLIENQPLEVGNLKFQVMETPGHTEGSVCLYLPAEQKLFAGDTLFAGSIGRTDLPGGDVRQIMASLHNKVMALPDDTTVIPGHGELTTIGVERASNPFVTGRVALY